MFLLSQVQHVIATFPQLANFDSQTENCEIRTDLGSLALQLGLILAESFYVGRELALTFQHCLQLLQSVEFAVDLSPPFLSFLDDLLQGSNIDLQLVECG